MVSGNVGRLATHLSVALVAPLAVAVLRLFPPLPLIGQEGSAWLAPLAGALATSACGLGMTVMLAVGLRDGRTAALIISAALGCLTAGLGVAAFRASAGFAPFPDAGLPVAALAAAALLLAAQLAPDWHLSPGRQRTAAAVGIFLASEAALAAALFVPSPLSAAPWMLAAAGALAAASAFPGPGLPAGLLAGGLVAMAGTRPDALDAVPGLLALAAGGIGFAWRAQAAVDGATEGAASSLSPVQPAPKPRPRPVTEPEPATRPQPADPGPTAEPMDDEALRLARELRGTIEELLAARRTIELQRAEISRGTATDPLTGVGTRRAILERLSDEAAQARRYDHPLAVLLVDLDGLTDVNREYGLAVGDAVLRELSLRLRVRMRAADALGRLAADSFLAILPHTDERGAAIFADALRRRLTARPVPTPGGERSITVSIGVAFMRAGMKTADEELLFAADEALASARAAGGNRIAFDRAHGLVRLEERRKGGRGGEQRPDSAAAPRAADSTT